MPVHSIAQRPRAVPLNSPVRTQSDMGCISLIYDNNKSFHTDGNTFHSAMSKTPREVLIFTPQCQ